MKRVGILVITACFVMVSGSAYAAWFGKKKAQEGDQPVVQSEQKASEQKAVPAVPAAPSAPKADKAIEKELKERRDAVAKKMNMLNNTEWQIEMTPMAAPSGKAPKKEIEFVTFKNNQVSFSGFGKKGFPTTNLTLTIQDDGSVIWETMQTSEKSGVCFWRGELDKGMMNMRGVLSHKIDAKTKTDYTFVSTSRKSIPADK